MDRKTIENIIQQSIKNLIYEYELMNSTFLQVLHMNIDQLAFNSEKWFGQSVPEEYKKVLNSLVTLSYLYFDRQKEMSKSLVEQKYEEIELTAILRDITDDVQSLLSLSRIDISASAPDPYIKTSRQTFRDSILNIFLSLNNFLGDDSHCEILLYEEYSSVKIDLSFRNLKKNVPDVSKLMKIFYSYYEDGQYHIGIGLSSALDSLRSIGGVVSIDGLQGSSALTLRLSFPSATMIKTIEEMRKEEENASRQEEKGHVVLCVEDIIIEMVLLETLQDSGYSVEKLSLFNMSSMAPIFQDKPLIADINAVNQVFDSFEAFLQAFSRSQMILIIYGSDDIIDTSVQRDNLLLIPKPFDVETILRLLDTGTSPA